MTMIEELTACEGSSALGTRISCLNVSVRLGYSYIGSRTYNTGRSCGRDTSGQDRHGIFRQSWLILLPSLLGSWEILFLIFVGNLGSERALLIWKGCTSFSTREGTLASGRFRSLAWDLEFLLWNCNTSRMRNNIWWLIFVNFFGRR
jgi:hypothetical protein